MRLLLDTQVFLWWQAGDTRLDVAVRDTIARADLVYVSAASAWEAAMLAAAGRLRMPESFERGVERSQFTKLPITFAHAEAVAVLPPQDGHDDRVDRLLIAQATVEGLTIATADPRFGLYRVPVLWASSSFEHQREAASGSIAGEVR